MTKLTDLQSLLLTHAAVRADGSLYALPVSFTADPARVMKAVSQLLRRGLLDEREVAGIADAHREDGDLRHGVFVTPAGLAAIGAEPAKAPPVAAREPAATAKPEDADADAPRQSKSALVLDLLRREGGATLAQLVAATGWLPHTTRAALTSLRKKGHAIERERRDGVSHYRIVSAA